MRRCLEPSNATCWQNNDIIPWVPQFFLGYYSWGKFGEDEVASCSTCKPFLSPFLDMVTKSLLPSINMTLSHSIFFSASEIAHHGPVSIFLPPVDYEWLRTLVNGQQAHLRLETGLEIPVALKVQRNSRTARDHSVPWTKKAPRPRDKRRKSTKWENKEIWCRYCCFTPFLTLLRKFIQAFLWIFPCYIFHKMIKNL